MVRDGTGRAPTTMSGLYPSTRAGPVPGPGQPSAGSLGSSRSSRTAGVPGRRARPGLGGVSRAYLAHVPGTFKPSAPRSRISIGAQRARGSRAAAQHLEAPCSEGAERPASPPMNMKRSAMRVSTSSKTHDVMRIISRRDRTAVLAELLDGAHLAEISMAHQRPRHEECRRPPDQEPVDIGG